MTCPQQACTHYKRLMQNLQPKNLMCQKKVIKIMLPLTKNIERAQHTHIDHMLIKQHRS